MTDWSLDRPCQCGTMVLIAITESQTSVDRITGVILATGQKTPRAILVIHKNGMRGFDLSGKALSPTEIDARFPGACEQALSMARSANAQNPPIASPNALT